MRLALLVGAPVTLALGPREQSVRLALTFLVVLIPRGLDVPRPFDLAFVPAMWLQAWGNVFGAFDHVYGYDKLVHFVLPCASSTLIYLGLVRLRVVPELATERGLHRRAGTLLLTCCLGLAFFGGLYELYEWLADHYLGAHLYVAYGDSISDLTDDALGSLLGGALILLWDAYGWATRRRARLGEARPARGHPVEAAVERIVERLAPGPHRPERRESPPSLPRWLVGDWTGPVRDPIDILRLSFLAGVVLAATGGHAGTTLRFALTFAAVALVRGLDVPRPFDLAFVLAMAIQAWED
jgi:hypothetical protein